MLIIFKWCRANLMTSSQMQQTTPSLSPCWFGFTLLPTAYHGSSSWSMKMSQLRDWQSSILSDFSPFRRRLRKWKHTSSIRRWGTPTRGRGRSPPRIAPSKAFLRTPYLSRAWVVLQSNNLISPFEITRYPRTIAIITWKVGNHPLSGVLRYWSVAYPTGCRD